ncbi:PLD nuclease N-terminal domain-containing protein [Gulosibacter chungangensis]|nr:PLD nuclease N-terminal domain-containing protein [Gulosibacter chungangensis]
MSRALILGIVVAVALTVYAVVDCAMFDSKRTKVMQKPIWLVVILLIPVIGPLLWMFIGKGSGDSVMQTTVGTQIIPDDINYISDPKSEREHDARIAELEEQMRLLDEEIERDRQSTMRNHPSNHNTGAIPTVEGEDLDEDDTSKTNGDKNGNDDEGRRQ